MSKPEYPFLKRIGRILNSRQTKSILLTGNIHDLFYAGSLDDYVPLSDFLIEHWQHESRIIAVYEINGPVRFPRPADREKMKQAWIQWRIGLSPDQISVRQMLSSSSVQDEICALNESFDRNLIDAIGKPTLALEILRQMCLCSRTKVSGKPILEESLIIIIEGADFLIPAGEISRLSDSDRQRTAICQDWFSDPSFMRGNDAVVLLAESRSSLNERVSRLPQILEVEAPCPDADEREYFISWFDRQAPDEKKLKLWGTYRDLANFSGGLTIHALRQLLIGAVHEEKVLALEDVVIKVEEFIQSQLGEDVIEFKKPQHTLADVIGYEHLRKYLKNEFIPRCRAHSKEAISGAAVCGPIGSGKTYIFEAVAAELDIVVLTLKNIRSQWFGQTDVIFERLRRVLLALSKVLIFVDEADTQFGSVAEESHSTERRLTGKIQAMMSDAVLRGRVIWLLATARVHLLSPDIRRPGRVGDLIIPILDPTDEDRNQFVAWAVSDVFAGNEEGHKRLCSDVFSLTRDFSAASFSSLKSELLAKAGGKKLTGDEILSAVRDILPPNIGKTRRYQTLQAVINCTRRSLLPKGYSPEKRDEYLREILLLEQEGIS